MWDEIEKELRLVVEPEISPYRGPLYFARPRGLAEASKVITNGGFGLVDTGERKLLVTCNHVWEGLGEAQLEDPDVRLHLCLDLQDKRAVVVDERGPIDRDPILDIAVFDLAPVLSACAGRKFYPLNQNPPPRVEKGSKLVVLGNQGMNRTVTSEGVELGLTIYAVEVASVDGWRFLADMAGARIRNLRPPARVPQGSPHGGISGSPCFSYRQGRVCQLVGFATGHLPLMGSDYLCFTHARCINRDGTIKRDIV